MSDFYTKTNCDRCSAPLAVRVMSWFTEDAICIECSKDEREIRRQLPNFGSELEGCGYIPEILVLPAGQVNIDNVLLMESNDE